MRMLAPNERRIYKQIKISGDHLNKFTGFLSYLRPYDETLIVPADSAAEDSIILNDAFDEALLKAMKEFFPTAIMQSKAVLYDATFVDILNDIESRTVRGFQVIVSTILDELQLFDEMKFDDFAQNLFIRYKLSPNDPILNTLPVCVLVNLPPERIAECKEAIYPV